MNAKLIQMKVKYLNEPWLVVKDKEAANTLIEPAKRRYLEPFMSRDLTLQQAADALGVKPNTMLYQVKRLLRLELLKVVRIEQRKGMASKVYRSSAPRFLVPFNVTAAATIEDLLFELEAKLLRTFVRNFVRVRTQQSEGWALGFEPADNSKLEVEFLPEEDSLRKREGWQLKADAPAVTNHYLTVNLGEGDAKWLQREFEKLVRATMAKEDLAENSYLVQLAMVPLEA